MRNPKFILFINTIILAGVVGLLFASGYLHSSSNESDITENKHIFGPGDNKQGYDSIDYKTNTLDLQRRIGKEADLLSFVQNPPLGLPAVPVPADNPLTKEKVSLGRRIFFDRRLSINDTFSCAICHIPEQGFTNNEIQTAIGVEGRSGKRNSPTIYNIAYHK